MQGHAISSRLDLLISKYKWHAPDSEGKNLGQIASVVNMSIFALQHVLADVCKVPSVKF